MDSKVVRSTEAAEYPSGSPDGPDSATFQRQTIVDILTVLWWVQMCLCPTQEEDHFSLDVPVDMLRMTGDLIKAIELLVIGRADDSAFSSSSSIEDLRRRFGTGLAAETGGEV